LLCTTHLDYDLTLKDDYLTIPERPGLGIDIDETAGNTSLKIAELPHWRREDGSVQEW
jgi:L-alanine-DL-glutamate epimerase-like enolase superfamily enzyme